MNKYKKLAFNTTVFAIGTFTSKIFSLLLNNLYTKNISPGDFYIKNLFEAVALFMLPVFTFSLTEAIIRFGLDKHYNSREVFSTSLILTGSGLALMSAVTPFLRSVPFLSPIKSYTLMLILYITASALRSVCSHFVQSCGYIRLFAADGILTTVLLFIFNVFFISRLGMGVLGFMTASVLADVCSSVFLFFTAKLFRFFGIKYYSKKLAKGMLRFTAPLIPTFMMWSITELSDQMFIGNMQSKKVTLGEEAAGLYAAATKIPNLLSMVSAVFFKAWNMSAITENNSADRNQFYERVYTAYESAMFIGSALLMLFIKPVSSILINFHTFPEYSTVYLYTPLLISAAAFNCLNQFLFGIYTATKHTANAFATTLVTCLCNILLNTILIPNFGIQGAAAATFLSYLLCYLIRMYDSRRYVPFGFSILRTLVNSLAVLAMSFIIIFDVKRILCVSLLVAVVLLLNMKSMLLTVRRLIKK